MSLFDIKDQVVVITGGTGVLGRAIGSHLHAKVPRLFCWDAERT